MKELKKLDKEKMLIRACHKCTKITESFQEIERCSHCKKAFLPLHYFEKIHDFKGSEWKKRFSNADDLEEEDLIKGLLVLW
jgi:predicted nucleic acid binding AN1-type Zn finger protein